MTDTSLHQAKVHLQKVDPILSKLISALPPFEKQEPRVDYFIALVDSIISQQLSLKAAATIQKRFEELFPERKVTPETVMHMDPQVIRDAGLSYAKISYIKDLAQKTIESGILFEQFKIMTDEEVIEELVKVKGIGRWTAEMFSMFALGRPDVFSYGDLGLRNAIKKLYQFEENPTKEEAEAIAAKWSPYRTLASRYLWKSLEMK